MATLRSVRTHELECVLNRQHRAIAALLDRLGAIPQTEALRRAKLFETVRVAVLSHMRAARAVLHPDLPPVLSSDAHADPAHAACGLDPRDQAEIERVLELAAASGDDPSAFDVWVFELTWRFDEHAREEEHAVADLLARARIGVDPDELLAEYDAWHEQELATLAGQQLSADT